MREPSINLSYLGGYYERTKQFDIVTDKFRNIR